MPDCNAHDAATLHAGWQAELSLAFACRAGATRLVGRHHRGPLRVQKALYPEGAQVCHAIVIHPPGGVVGGDRLQLDAAAGAGAHAVLTTPGAAKWYRANGKTSSQDVRLTADTGAAIEWLPQESIFYNKAQVALRHDVELAAGASYLGCEILCLGRRASGEIFKEGRINQRTGIRLDGKPVWWEQGLLTPAVQASPLGLAGHSVCATLLAVGKPLGGDVLKALRALDGGPRCGATQASRQVLALRWLGDDSEQARELMLAALAIVRPALLGRDAIVPRSWRT